MQHAVRGLTERLGDGELVQLLVVALLQVDDLALRGAADEDHRIAVGRGMGQRGQAVEEARRRHREADTRLLRQESGARKSVVEGKSVSVRLDLGGVRMCKKKKEKGEQTKHRNMTNE